MSLNFLISRQRRFGQEGMHLLGNLLRQLAHLFVDFGHLDRHP